MNTGRSTKRLITKRQSELRDQVILRSLASDAETIATIDQVISDLQQAIQLLQHMLDRHLNNRQWLASK